MMGNIKDAEVTVSELGCCQGVKGCQSGRRPFCRILILPQNLSASKMRIQNSSFLRFSDSTSQSIFYPTLNATAPYSTVPHTLSCIFKLQTLYKRNSEAKDQNNRPEMF